MAMIINADDFGKTEEVNQAICECFRLHYIDRTTLMVNMPYADEAVRLAGEQGFAEQIGLHLNLTAGRPLTEAIRSNPLFCDEKGEFHAHFHQSMKTRLWMSHSDRRQVRDELEAQIKKYLAYGCTLKHVDSHHHVHTDLPVLKALEPLLKKYELQSIRIGRNLMLKEKTQVYNLIYKDYYNRRLKRTGLTVTQYFGSANDFRSYSRYLRLNVQQFIGKRSVEIMTHPMYDTDGALVDTTDIMDASWCRSLGRVVEEN